MPTKTDEEYSSGDNSEARKQTPTLVTAADSGRLAEVPQQAKGLIVLGMHRSGTSAITDILVSLGYEVPGEPVPARWDNPRGYWEPREIVELHEEFLHAIDRSWSDPRPLDSDLFQGAVAAKAKQQLRGVTESSLRNGLWVVKDPRMCRLMPLWEGMFDAEQPPHILHIVRSPLSVAKSLQQRDGFSQEKSLLLWLRHNLEAEAATRGQDRTWLHFEALTSTSLTHSVELLRTATGSAWLPAKQVRGAIESTIDRSLVHYTHEIRETIDRLSSHPWIARAYGAFDCLGTSRDAEGREQLDALRAQIHEADISLNDAAIWKDEAHEERYFWLRQEIESYHRSIEAQRREVEAQRAEVDTMRAAFETEREHLETIRTDIAKQHGTVEAWRHEQLLQEGESATRQQAIAQSVNDHIETNHQSIELQRREIEAQRAEVGEMRAALETEHERLGVLHTDIANQHGSLGTWRDEWVLREEAAETRRQGIAAALDALGGQEQAILESVSTIHDLITQKLEKHHLALLGKSLDVSARIEAQWVEVQDERDRAYGERDALAAERDASLNAQAEAIAARDRALQERDTAKVERAAAIEAQAVTATERDQALRERDDARAEKDTVLDAQTKAIEARDRALQERDTAKVERASALDAQANAAAERDRALQEHADAEEKKAAAIDNQTHAFSERDQASQERDRALQERDGALQERDRALQERDGALQERDGALQERDGALQERDGALVGKETADQALEDAELERDNALRKLSATIALQEEAEVGHQLALTELDTASSELRQVRLERDQTRHEIDQLLRRRSWRMTAPLRSLYKALRNDRDDS